MIERAARGCVRNALASLTSPAIPGGFGSALDAPGHPWPRAEHTTLARALRTHPRAAQTLVVYPSDPGAQSGYHQDLLRPTTTSIRTTQR